MLGTSFPAEGTVSTKALVLNLMPDHLRISKEVSEWLEQ